MFSLLIWSLLSCFPALSFLCCLSFSFLFSLLSFFYFLLFSAFFPFHSRLSFSCPLLPCLFFFSRTGWFHSQHGQHQEMSATGISAGKSYSRLSQMAGGWKRIIKKSITIVRSLVNESFKWNPNFVKLDVTTLNMQQ